MVEFEINGVFTEFDVEGVPVETVPIKSGHINQTFLIRTDLGGSYILQRINHHVFPDPEAVIENKILVARHIAEKRSGLPEGEFLRRVLRFFPTRSDGPLHRDQEGNFWNLMNYIENSSVYLRTPNSKVAFEAGKAFGGFLMDTEDLDPDVLKETIPGFHSMSLRYSQFDEAYENASKSRKELAESQIREARHLRERMHGLERRIAEGTLPLRVTHNDTKISNALFSDDDEALCVIDLDTVMRGVVHFDFGDAVRTVCNRGEEDEHDLSKVDFDMTYFESFTRGFLGESGLTLSDQELEGLAFSAQVMTFIVGLRMLTDFLNNDIYFDTAYEIHNLVRTKCQFRLAELIGKRLDQMEDVVRRAAQ